MVRANGISYAFLLLLFVAGSFTPALARPVFQVMQPVNEAIIGSAFWLGGHISGHTKEEPSLIEAIEAGDLKKVQKLVAAGADANQRNSVGFSAFSIAAGLGESKLTKLLLDAGADVNARSVTLNDTALSRAAQRGDPETVRVLVHAGADLEAKDGSGWTPLFNAALSGNAETVQILVSAGADINARTPYGWTALKEAQMRGYENIARQLMFAGAIDFPDGSR